MITLDKEKHIYTVDGKVVPGVSEVLSAAGMIDLWGIPVFALEAARKLGTAAHLACEYYDDKILKKSTLDIFLRPYLDGWIKFKADHCIEILEGIEVKGYSRKWGFAGTLDRVAAIKGKLILIDIKTSAVLHPTVGPQLAAYKIIWEENNPDQRINQRWAVQLTPGDYKINCCKDNYDESVFISALQVYKFRKKNNLLKEVEYEREIFGM